MENVKITYSAKYMLHNFSVYRREAEKACRKAIPNGKFIYEDNPGEVYCQEEPHGSNNLEIHIGKTNGKVWLAMCEVLPF